MTGPRPNEQQQAAMSAALSGAVDLSGLKARADAQRGGADAGALGAPGAPGGADAPPPPVPTGPNVVAVTEENFQSVIEQSMQVPVILEFYVARADQSQQYGDLFERLAADSDGTWILGKVEVESAMRIAQAMQIQGVPAVRAVFQGQIVAEFDGKQPEDKVREFLKAIVEGTGGTLPEGAGPQEDPRVEEAENAIAEGDLDKAEELYNSLLADDPAHALAKDALKQIQLMRRLGSDPDADVDAVIRDADAAPDDIDKAMKAADLQVAAGEYDAAFGRLLSFVRGTDDDAKEAARARLIELFAIVGNEESAVQKGRRDLASALF
ncbi:tetratricopeptide repeat protein [Epidermidibacterium keratini]|uniref:Tetratricopeptide repeat protein n=1 Tax=Epidermidibacterium keratini TaxID=1891644 RepID=A0A7L4YT92_9ACTN|nr:tetratricopeptide repeat protein [Epidermidibacterium keratini]QHC01747.1 tetratricopeptide repeat protein [Epidermidibacterium keratini]